jgi:hypothetical protein
MSREVASAAVREHPPVLLDDCRLQLSSDNVFRFCAQNGMPPVSAEEYEDVCLLTAAEIEAERLAAKASAQSCGRAE